MCQHVDAWYKHQEQELQARIIQILPQAAV